MGVDGLVVRVSEEEVGWLREGAPREESVARWLGGEDPEAFELEDALAGVDYLLSGGSRQGPLGFLGASYGEAIPEVLGRPARLLSRDEVASVAHAVESIAARTVRLRLDHAALAALEPFRGRPLEDDHKEWLLAVLQGLMVFVRRAAEDHMALLVLR